jgi:hypothetical protein
MALASRVFPVPGGPTNKAPFGILAPRSVYFLGVFRKSTISWSSSLASSSPATSLKVMLVLLPPSKTWARLLPMLKIWPPGPPAPPMRRITNIQTRAMAPKKSTHWSNCGPQAFCGSMRTSTFLVRASSTTCCCICGVLPM